MTAASANPRPLHPRTWPTWIGLGGFWLIEKLPWTLQKSLARLLAWIVYAVVPFRRRIVLTNLRLCFPEKSETEIRQLAREHYHALALGIFETCLAWWASGRRLPKHEIVGLENLRAAQATGRGVILLTAHFTTLEICARILSEQVKFGCLFREANNPVVGWQMRANREHHTTIAIHFDDLRGLIRALKAGHIIWYAPDQAKRTKFSEILPFFGVPSITNTATSRLVEMTGALVVPYFGQRRADGSYLLNVFPALENFPTPDASADAVRINRLMEENIRLAPDQYFWVHKKFKARGAEYPDVYAR